ncbi:hypothetical protein SAMN04489712_12557 [Thermomonospora echinospora]|uniref:Uncharacterized protein n=1 Tax=Thermomonospora echinospora TaxID=1992 RepID=A0A1H6DZS8_9ACTN|nr:hypothetical protein SAMN04489712_12557 [Thermomonospora echinospora]
MTIDAGDAVSQPAPPDPQEVEPRFHLYETAARAEEILPLNAEGLGCSNVR